MEELDAHLWPTLSTPAMAISDARVYVPDGNTYTAAAEERSWKWLAARGPVPAPASANSTPKPSLMPAKPMLS
ncbi:hypothetical protein TIFTF001_003772 [Ficus carica]|uniref:Uncharacterized protein n=1 Tax=Ficus carica TaxID=3494 RepID=A0AA87ZGB1_FICCA|nr:hypothetical protein TIFTF001_003772 [Ficus carica]